MNVPKERIKMQHDLQNIIKIEIDVFGRVTQSDIIGAVFGQTEDVLGTQLDLRTLQKSNKIGRIEVETEFTGEKTIGIITIPSYMDRIYAVIIAAALETINKIGPCRATARVLKIVNVKEIKIKEIVEHAKKVLEKFMSVSVDSQELIDEVNASFKMSQLTTYGKDEVQCGYGIKYFDDLIMVETVNELKNLMKYGLKNVAVFEDCSKMDTLKELAEKYEVTVFIDRGKEYLLRKLVEATDVDKYAVPPHGKYVRDLQSKEIFQALRDAVSCEQFSKKSVEIKHDHREYVKPSYAVPKPDGEAVVSSGSVVSAGAVSVEGEDSGIEKQKTFVRDSRNFGRDNRNFNRDNRNFSRDDRSRGFNRDGGNRNINRNFNRDEHRDEHRSRDHGRNFRDGNMQRIPERIPEGELSVFKARRNELEGTNEAFVLDDKMNVLGKLPLDALEETLKGLKAYCIIIAGQISRNLIYASERARVKYLIGKSADGRSRYVNIVTEN